MYTFDSRIRYSETDSEGKLTMASLINYFQDCSTFQSEDLGVGLSYLRHNHMVWVLSAWQIVVERYPKLCERVTVGTQPYDLKGFLGYRNFAMLDEAGKYVARANSLWSLLNTDTGKPCPVPEAMREKYTITDKLEMDYAPRKIRVPDNGVSYEPVTVKTHHLDTNHHVNNQQFVNIAMDCLPQGFPIRQLRVEYKKQAFLNDVMIPYVAEDGNNIVVALQDTEGSPYAVTEFERRTEE